jgi:hypothetical protein
MDRNELTEWALASGWQPIEGFLSLTEPSSPTEAVVRMVFKTEAVDLEVKKPTGEWVKVTSEKYVGITRDIETGLPRGLGLTFFFRPA